MLPSEMTDGNPPQGLGEEEGPDLAARLSDMSPERLAEEVISVWEEVLRVEGELATARQRGRALEMELDARESGGSNRARVAELEEALRVVKKKRLDLALYDDQKKPLKEELLLVSERKKPSLDFFMSARFSSLEDDLGSSFINSFDLEKRNVSFGLKFKMPLENIEQNFDEFVRLARGVLSKHFLKNKK